MFGSMGAGVSGDWGISSKEFPKVLHDVDDIFLILWSGSILWFFSNWLVYFTSKLVSMFFLFCFFFFFERQEITGIACSSDFPLFLYFLTVLSLNSNLFYQCFLLVSFACKYPSLQGMIWYESSKRRNHQKPENLETLFLLSALKMPILSQTLATKQKQNTKKPNCTFCNCIFIFNVRVCSYFIVGNILFLSKNESLLFGVRVLIFQEEESSSPQFSRGFTDKGGGGGGGVKDLDFFFFFWGGGGRHV